MYVCMIDVCMYACMHVCVLIHTYVSASTGSVGFPSSVLVYPLAVFVYEYINMYVSAGWPRCSEMKAWQAGLSFQLPTANRWVREILILDMLLLRFLCLAIFVLTRPFFSKFMHFAHLMSLFVHVWSFTLPRVPVNPITVHTWCIHRLDIYGLRTSWTTCLRQKGPHKIWLESPHNARAVIQKDCGQFGIWWSLQAGQQLWQWVITFGFAFDAQFHDLQLPGSVSRNWKASGWELRETDTYTVA